jgi:predicted RecB family nuclease
MTAPEQELPPFVRFGLEELNSRVTDGKVSLKEVHMVYVTQPGSRDTVAYKVDRWFAQMEKLLADRRIPPQWVEAWRQSYERFKQGLSPTVEGTPLEAWPGVSRRQMARLKELGIYSVEAVAQMSAEAVNNVGMGATELKVRAKAFLDTAKNISSVSEELVKLRLANEALREELEEVKRGLAQDRTESE